MEIFVRLTLFIKLREGRKLISKNHYFSQHKKTNKRVVDDFTNRIFPMNYLYVISLLIYFELILTTGINLIFLRPCSQTVSLQRQNTTLKKGKPYVYTCMSLKEINGVSQHYSFTLYDNFTDRHTNTLIHKHKQSVEGHNLGSVGFYTLVYSWQDFILWYILRKFYRHTNT